ncbi:MAG TPA: L-histidine N(alpha)-methyltransferase, partial [Anaeromyxobacteraceae bacterium]|nr:L-histidine N(alpha)-methyltransferase [Anaeromyxobacteraceae bacterium]
MRPQGAAYPPATPFEALGTRSQFLADVLRGLARAPKEIPCKWLYDARGSALFERICDLA